MSTDGRIGKGVKMLFKKSLLILIMFCFIYNVSASTVYISPNRIYVEKDTLFDLSFVCNPSQPVKGYEFKFSFNSDVLTVNDVYEGVFFNGFSTFFNKGIIDNINGSVINIYGLIIGQGNVSATGTLITINFTVVEEGISVIDVYDAGVVNESMYLPLSVLNGVVQAYDTYPPWDINCDGIVNYFDVSVMVDNYGIVCGHPGCNPADVVADGRVDYLDVSIICYYYGKS